MRKIWNKGHRIRASDKHLVYHFSIGTLLFVFVAVLLLLNIKQLMCTDWEHFSLLENDLTLSPYNFITILIATGACVLVAFLYYRCTTAGTVGGANTTVEAVLQSRACPCSADEPLGI